MFQPGMEAQFGFDPKYPGFQGAITSLFLHRNALHLLGNMLFLASVGAAVEIAAGSARFSIVFFCGGLMGVLAHYLLTHKAEDPPILIGASGSVAACIAYYSARYVHLKVPIAPGKGVSVAVITGVWIALQAVGAIVRFGDPTSAVSFWAHIGGFGAGLLLSVIFAAPKLAELELSHRVLKSMNERSPGAALAAADRHLIAHPKDVKGLRERIEALSKLGECEEEGKALIQLMEILPESQQGEAVARLAEIGCLKLLPSLRRTMLAERLKTIEPNTAKLLLTSVVQDPRDTQRPDALLALAALEIEANPSAAKPYLDELTRSHAMDPAVEVARKRGWIE